MIFLKPIITTILISMLPLFELKGAIPLGMNSALWGNYSLSAVGAFFCAVIGSSLIVPLFAIILQPLLDLLKKVKFINRIICKLESSLMSRSETLKKQNNKLSFAIFLFVAIPLPLTGVYTGTALAVMLGLPFYKICLSVISGNVVAGILVTFLSNIVPNTSILLILFVCLTLITILINYIKNRKKHIN